MMKLYNLRFYFSLICICLFTSTGLLAQINTPSGAVVPFGSNQSYQYGIMPTNLPSGGTYGKSTDAASAYNEWKANYVEACGSNYRVKFDDPSKTVSEGIAYGMLLAAYAADKGLFDGLWAYYKANSDGNGFMNWRINGCSGVSGSGGATDADLDAAYALLVAKNQWPTATSPYTYNTEATNLINKIKQYEIHPSSYQAINGDGWGFSNSCRNISYQSPAYYRQFGIQNSGDASFWTSAVTGGYGLINANVNSSTGLVSDWSDPNGNMNTCNSNGFGGGATPGYGYDACRNPLRMAQDVIWNNTSQANSICSKIASYVNGQSASGVRGPLYQNGSLYSGNQHNATFVSTFAVAVMGSSSAYQSLMNSMYTETVNTKDVIQNQTLSGYFGNTLRCMSLFMMTGNFWKIGTTSLPDINVKTSAGDVLTGSTYDFQNVLKSSNKTVTFTIENKGFQTLNLTGSPKVALSGADAASFSVSQASVGSTLSGNSSVNFTITFNPSNSTGVKTATITIASNDSDEGTYTFTITGTGTNTATSPKISVYQDMTFYANNSTYSMGTSAVSSYNSVRFKIKNTGDAPLNITSITPSGTGYTVSGAPTSVAKGDSGYFFVRVTSATATTLNGSFTIANDDVTNPSYKVNLTSTIVACGSAITTNSIYQDFDGNYSNSTLDYTNSNWSESFANPYVDNSNPTFNVAKYTRPATGTYNGVRYKLCSSNTVSLTASKFVVTVMIYSPAVGVPVLMNLKTAADVANTTTYPSTSSVTVTTTKANQWEKLVFDHSSAIGKPSIQYIELFVDPNAAKGAATYYVDEIKLDAAPCLTDLPSSQVLNDYDNHINVTLAYSVTSYAGPVTNPSSTGLNTSATVGKFNKSGSAGAYSDGIRFTGCGNSFDLSSKKIISMLVYSTAAGATIQLSAKKPDGPDADTYPDDAVSATATTVFANQWHRLYFDLSAVAAADISSIFAFDIFFDPTVVKGTQTYYFDDIRYESEMPCVSGIPTSLVLNDFDFNRNLNVAFPGSFNTIYPNPSTTGINTSTNTGEFVRGTGTTNTSVRFQACQTYIDLSPGKSIINLMVYSPNANTVFTMSLKKADGTTSISDVTDTSGAANTWVDLSFDHSLVMNSTDAYYIDIIVDPSGTQSGATTTTAQRTYIFDNLRYSPAKPEIDLRAATTPTITDLPNYSSFNMGTATVGDSTTMTFNIVNDGSQDLLLGTPDITVAGANPSDFTITKSPSYSTTVGAFSATSFTVTFKPTASGSRSAKVTILSNDSDEGTYVFYLNGTAKAASMLVKQGSSTIVNSTGNYSFGTVQVGSSSSVVTFTIQNLGDDTLRLSGSPIIAITGNTSDFVIVQPTKSKIDPSTGTSPTTTFTIKFVPTVAGARSATISIANNDVSKNPYTFTITGTATCPIPATPGTISGSATPCQGTATTYSVTAVSGATSYTWTLPGGWTGTSTTNSISATPSSTSGSITVKANNTCGSSSTSSLTVTPASAPATPGTISGSNAVCSGSSNTYSVTAVSGATSYTWTLPGGWTGTSTTNSITATASATAGNVTVKASNTCGTSSASSLAVTINGSIGTPGTISGSATPCQSTATTYSIATVSGASSYTWTLPGGWTGTSTTNSISATPSSTSGNISVVANGTCGTSSSSTLAVTPSSIPATPGTISGSVTPCQSTATTYSVTAVSGATSYSWTLPGGWTGTSTTNSISATPSSTSGNITVKASNSCGTSSAASLSVAPTTAPSTPGSISGSATVCSGSANTYTVTAVSGATSYIWTLPGGWSGTSTTNSINATASTTAGNITVKASNSCGTSTASSLAVSISGSIGTPGTISGSSTPCQGTATTYSIAAVSGATSYTWTLPGGWTGTSTTTSISATPSSTSGNITVAANGSCGTSGAATLAVTPSSAPSTPGSISGSATPCQGTATTYSVTTVSGATSYSWTLPGGWSGTSSTNSISATPDGTSGSVSVTASNSCGTSSSQILAVTPDNGPGAAGSITGPSSVCSGATGQVFTIASVTGATGYDWTVPVDASITSGSNTTSITVTWGSSSGSVTVTPTNTCGNGTASPSYSVTLQTTACSAPSSQTISGPATVSAGQTGVTYSVSAAAPGSTYHWSLPIGSVITSASADSSSITVTFGSTSGDIVLTETNAAGSTQSTLSVGVNPTGVMSKILSAGVEVSPNPATGLFKVTLSEVFGGTINLKVTNVHGDLVYSGRTSQSGNSSEYSINLQDMPGGVYVLEIESENGIAIKRLIKE